MLGNYWLCNTKKFGEKPNHSEINKYTLELFCGIVIVDREEEKLKSTPV